MRHALKRLLVLVLAPFLGIWAILFVCGHFYIYSPIRWVLTGEWETVDLPCPESLIEWTEK